MSWATAPGLIIISGMFALGGGLYAGVDGLRNWIYGKRRFIHQDDFRFILNKKYGPGGKTL